MKELELKDKEKIEVVANQKKQIERELVGYLMPYNGHKVWEINIETGEIDEAKYAVANYDVFGENKKEIVIKDGFYYVSALNKQNAYKKAIKGTPSGKQMNTNPMRLIL